MNNNNILIDRYLQNEMSDVEKAEFESRLAIDMELQQELMLQRQIIKAVVDAGIKSEFAKVIKRKTVVKRMGTWGLLIAAGILLLLIFNFGSGIFSKVVNEGKEGLARHQETLRRFIDPPIPGINVPFSEYTFDAEKGDTIFYPSGSIIYFPPSALVDASGALVKGEVKITYREFADPLDFFVSGIPMGYDSGSVKYNFESAGMCEINAYKDDKPVFVNKNARPEINLSGSNKSPSHNLYYLDTVSQSWKYIGKDKITEVKNTRPSQKAIYVGPRMETSIIPAKPVEPVKAGDNPSFSIEIDPGSFEELFAYDGLRFEVLDQTNYKPSDANEHWSSVKLEHTSTEGIYNVVFTNYSRKVSYKVRPVLEGADYDAAMKIFQQKNREYEQALKSRVTQGQRISDSILQENKKVMAKMNADNDSNNNMNALINERNKRIREQKKLLREENQRMWVADSINIKKTIEQAKREWEKQPLEVRLDAEIMRSFYVNDFGVWNCDHPQYPDKEIPLLANLTDNANNKIIPRNIAVVYQGFNGITQFQTAQIRVIPNSGNMIWAVKDSTFYYFTYKDFELANISRGVRSFNFKMRRALKKISSYNDIRELTEKL